LVEVGTTNRTRVEDYAAAVTPKTVAILKVHASNFQVVGFTESVEIEALSRVARQQHVLLLHDLGSGSLLDTTVAGLAAEPRIQDSLRAGTDLLACSGDKLLGGPQAGLLLGRAELVEKVMKHSLARALRVDKLTLAALTATLDLYLTQSVAEHPIWNMLSAAPDAMAARATAWQRALMERGITVEVVAAESTVGGGSLPGERLPTTALSVTARSGRAADLLRRFRQQEPPVIGRIEQERVLLDPRTVLPDEDDALINAIASALA
jgi:L-seryl-tRNA(Ser) seleniumtransferase